MPPRPAIPGLQAALSTTTSLTWRATASPLTLASRFSTTSPASGATSSTVPPESPHYINLPEPPQSSEPKLPPIRGHVPVPRQVFTSRDGAKPRRVEPDYVDSIKPKSAAEQAGLPPANQHEARRRLLAETRRKSLAEGLQGLWQRKRNADKFARARATANSRKNIAAAMQPERLDEVLTRPTVRASTASVTTVALDPARFEDAEKAKAAHDEKMAVKAEARRDALCQMYMAAGQFIVDEAELEHRVNVVFDTDLQGAATDYGGNVWINGAPTTVRAAIANTWTSNVTDLRSRDDTRTQLRQKIVAEALTGGKL